MMFAGESLASTYLCGSINPGVPPVYDSWPWRAIMIEVDGQSWLSYVSQNSIAIDDTLGEQVSCSFTAVNPTSIPEIGNVVRVKYYDQVLFAGTIDRVRRTTNNTLTARYFECTCTDWSQVLVRNKIERNFINAPLSTIVQSLLANELDGEELTLGTIDRLNSIPLVDSRGGSAFDMLREAAGATGQTFYVDFDKSLQFRVTSNGTAPINLNVSTVESAVLDTDRETYRNVQRIMVTGTPASESQEDPVVTIEERTNDDQIAARAALEGGTGRYENFEEITHPTSNAPGDLSLLGFGYANYQLALAGVPRNTLSCRARSYGFRAGQFATVSIAALDVSGTWLIQRVTIHEEDGRRLVHDLELVQSSLQLRAYASWIKIVRSGKITVQMPGGLTSNIQTFATPGSDTWTVPAGITSVEFTVKGGAGGGGGSLYWNTYAGTPPVYYSGADGGDGGDSGLALTIFEVVEGDEFELLVGSGGNKGVNKGAFFGSGDAGTAGTVTWVKKNGLIICQGDGGGLGGAAYFVGNTFYAGQTGSPGNGVGDVVVVGGGFSGGDGGGNGPTPIDGSDGIVEVRW